MEKSPFENRRTPLREALPWLNKFFFPFISPYITPASPVNLRRDQEIYNASSAIAIPFPPW
jgi:hypothetical protein